MPYIPCGTDPKCLQLHVGLTHHYSPGNPMFALRFRSEYLSQFHPAPSPQLPSFVSALTERMACRVLVYFVRHASLVRPLSNDGKLRLAKVSHAMCHVHIMFDVAVSSPCACEC